MISANKGGDVVTKTIKVDGMKCPKCEARVKQSLEAIEGVDCATPDKDKKQAEVILSAEVTDQVLMDAVAEAGFVPVGMI